MDKDLAKRIERLEAIEAIRALKARYCQYCDRDYQPNELASLFTEDAVWDAGKLRGVFTGRDAIREFFARVPAMIPWAAHLVTNPLIEIGPGGNHATGSWRMLMPCTLQTPDGSAAAFQVAQYDEEYRREDGKWLFSRLKVRLRRLAHAELEWMDMSG